MTVWPILLGLEQWDFKVHHCNSTVLGFAPIPFCPAWGKANVGLEQAGPIQEEMILVAEFQDGLKQKCTRFLSQWNIIQTFAEAGLLPGPSWESKTSLCPLWGLLHGVRSSPEWEYELLRSHLCSSFLRNLHTCLPHMQWAGKYLTLAERSGIVAVSELTRALCKLRQMSLHRGCQDCEHRPSKKKKNILKTH